MRNRSPNQTAAAPNASRPRRSPWLAIAVAVVALVSIVSGELWALRQTPPDDNVANATLASDLERTLARVAEASLLIGPMN
jgi:hypothetical protein